MSETVRLNGIDFLARRGVLERREDGSMILRSPVPLGDVPDTVGDVLRDRAEAHPDRPFLVDCAPDGLTAIDYGTTWRRACGIARDLLARGLGPDRPVMVLSGNSSTQALVSLGAMLAGVPVAPVSPAYSLMSRDFAKLKYIHDLIRPGLVLADTAEPFAAALEALGPERPPLVDKAAIDAIPATDTPPDCALGPDSLAKILFTSGSTGMPKGVINTQRMLCANQAMLAATWPFVREMAPVMLDWLPWNHTFGGNFCFNLALFNGGTLHIDDGRPAPHLIARTAENLRRVSPNVYFNVPAGFAALLPFLERDEDLAARFFRDLRLVFYAGAALPQDLWDRLAAVAARTGGPAPLMLSAWGSTETAPLATMVHFPIPRAGNIGLPVPGCELKFAPEGDKLELRVRGPNVTPGYFGRDDLTTAAFDDEGFYRMGDAGLLADAADPSAGVLFNGRVAEDFKLTTGTWVHVGALRVGAVAACSPLVQDMVIAGHDRDRIGVLVWPNPAACTALDADIGGDPAKAAASVAVRRAIAAALGRWNASNPASSTRIATAMLLAEPPSIDANEITDKGYVNQRATLVRRAGMVARLFTDGDPGVIVPG